MAGKTYTLFLSWVLLSSLAQGDQNCQGDDCPATVNSLLQSGKMGNGRQMDFGAEQATTTTNGTFDTCHDACKADGGRCKACGKGQAYTCQGCCCFVKNKPACPSTKGKTNNYACTTTTTTQAMINGSYPTCHGACAADGCQCKACGKGQAYTCKGCCCFCPSKPTCPSTIGNTNNYNCQATTTTTTAVQGYVPALDNGPANCCSHNAPWDDQFTLMCKTCAYDTLGKGQSGTTYKWFRDGVSTYEITCSNTSASSVRCQGKNNENGGRPGYTGTCGASCLPTTTIDFKDHSAVKEAFLGGKLVAHSKMSKASDSCPQGQTPFWCQNGNPSMSTDGYDYCGDNTLCPANMLQSNWRSSNKPGDRVDGNCCYCGACLSYQA